MFRFNDRFDSQLSPLCGLDETNCIFSMTLRGDSYHCRRAFKISIEKRQPKKLSPVKFVFHWKIALKLSGNEYKNRILNHTHVLQSRL